VSLGSQPEYELPDLPRDLTALSDQRLMTLFAEMVSWQNYAATKLAEAEVEETKAEANQRYQENMVMVAVRPGTKVTETRALMSKIPEVMEARQRFLDAYALRKTTGVVYTNCERVVNLISRELTRRVGGRSERIDGRNNRWNP
jgi:hypothetical protein